MSVTFLSAVTVALLACLFSKIIQYKHGDTVLFLVLHYHNCNYTRILNMVLLLKIEDCSEPSLNKSAKEN